MKDDIEALRETIIQNRITNGSLAALNRLRARVAELEKVAENDGACIAALTHGLNERNAERDRLQARVAELERELVAANEIVRSIGRLWTVAETERDSLRAKLDEIEQALTECGLPAQLGNPPEPWPARDRILGAYADYLKRHNEACNLDMENWSLRAKLERAKPIVEAYVGKNPKWVCPERGEQDPMGAHALIVELSADAPAQQTFQDRVQPWLMACFGPEISADRVERNHRFLEEALELVQACECPREDAHQLVDYVYDRDIGEPHQEVGGVQVTLAALCLANALDMRNAGEDELARIWTKVEKIRVKQAAKPKGSPLPQHVAPAPQTQISDEGTK